MDSDTSNFQIGSLGMRESPWKTYGLGDKGTDIWAHGIGDRVAKEMQSSDFVCVWVPDRQVGGTWEGSHFPVNSSSNKQHTYISYPES